MEMAKETVEAKKQFNQLFGNMFEFDDEDMTNYDPCYEAVFSKGLNLSFMSLVFYAQFSAELLLGMLTSNSFRKYLIGEIDAEKGRAADAMNYWSDSMNENRFGIIGRDYTQDKKDLEAFANDTYLKVAALNEWYGTEDGKKEFDMYCLSKKAVKDIKRIFVEYPYLIRRYDYDQKFATEIMEYAGIVANQIASANNE